MAKRLKVESYRVRDGSHVKAKDAPKVVRAVTAITKASGAADATSFLEYSTPKTSETHHMFEWNDGKAAHEHRLLQARNILGSIELVFEGSSDYVRAFPTVIIGGEKKYAQMQRCMSDAELTAQLIAAAQAELIAWDERHAALRRVAALAGVFEAIDAVRTGA